MKIAISLISILLFSFTSASFTFGQNYNKQEIMKQLSVLLPNLKVEDVSESEIPGLFEVVTNDGNIIYWSPKGYIIFGEIWTWTGKSITHEKKEELKQKRR